MSPQGWGYLLAITTGICWAVLAIGLKYALGFAGTGTIAWVRMAVAFGLMGIWIVGNVGRSRIWRRPPPVIVLAGLGLAFNYFGYMKAIELSSATHAQIMIQFAPMTLLLTGVIYFKEKIERSQWVGIVIALSGFTLFNWDQLMLKWQSSGAQWEANLWLLFAALTWTFYASVQKRLMREWPPSHFNFIIYGVATLALLPGVDWIDLATPTPFQLLVLFLMGANTLLAYGGLGEALKRLPATHVSLIISVNPLLTITLLQLMDHFNWDWVRPEPLGWRGYLGAGLVVAGVALGVTGFRSISLFGRLNSGRRTC